MQLCETDTGLVYAGGEPLQVYGEATLVLNFGGGLVVLHAFLTADSHLLDMDFLASYGVCVALQADQLKAAGQSYQIVCEGEWIGDQLVNLVHDVLIPASNELLALVTSTQLDHDPIMIGTVSGWRKFT